MCVCVHFCIRPPCLYSSCHLLLRLTGLLKLCLPLQTPKSNPMRSSPMQLAFLAGPTHACVPPRFSLLSGHQLLGQLGPPPSQLQLSPSVLPPTSFAGDQNQIRCWTLPLGPTTTTTTTTTTRILLLTVLLVLLLLLLLLLHLLVLLRPLLNCDCYHDYYHY